MSFLVTFDGVTIVRDSSEVVFRDFTWRVRDGETWAIVGPVGSGKSTLAEAIAGRHRVTEGAVAWPFFEHGIVGPATIRLVSFKEHAAGFSYARHYYQQRFNFVEPHDDLTLEDFLRDGNSPPEADLDAVTRRLGVGRLRPLSFIKLSNGESRRARIAKALLARPAWLILDEPFLGLDLRGRTDLLACLDDIRRAGTNLTVICRPEWVPPWVTHVLDLSRPGDSWAGPQTDWTPTRLTTRPPAGPIPAASGREPIVELKNVHVRHGGRAILDGLTWTVRAGERWVVTGPNGSGKSTLLSLIYGDHPQAYGNDITLFGRPRGTGETVWDLKARMGFVSPEFHLYFSEPLTAAGVVATGFFDGVAPRPVTAEQSARVRFLLQEFDLAGLAERPFGRLSVGQQRLVLFLRAVVKRPELILLDEPFQGFDPPNVARARDWLDRNVAEDQTLIMVSHDRGDVPRIVTQRLKLNDP